MTNLERVQKQAEEAVERYMRSFDGKPFPRISWRQTAEGVMFQDMFQEARERDACKR